MTQPQAGPVQRTKIKYVVSIGEKSLSKVTLLTVSKPALDGFLSTVDRNGTGTERYGDGKIDLPFCSKRLPVFTVLLEPVHQQNLPFFTVQIMLKSATFFPEKLT